MGRRAILISEKDGQYEISPNAQPESYKAVMADATSVRVVEELKGGDYNWVIETDIGWYFVTGWKRPREKGMSGPPPDICAPTEGMVTHFTRQQDAKLLAEEEGGHVHREPTDDGRSFVYCVCYNPACES